MFPYACICLSHTSRRGKNNVPSHAKECVYEPGFHDTDRKPTLQFADTVVVQPHSTEFHSKTLCKILALPQDGHRCHPKHLKILHPGTDVLPVTFRCDNFKKEA